MGRSGGQFVKVFISSVRRGLEAERDALRGLILALGHEPSRFEDFTAQGVPSREACLQGVRDADTYVLLLGERYGDPLPDTGLAPTEEEFVAAQAKGIPILAFVKRGVASDDRQKTFIDRVSNYVDGRFRQGFEGVPDLLASVGEAIREVAARPTSLAWTDVPAGVLVPWRQPDRGLFTGRGTELATYVVPVEGSSRLQATVLAGLPERLARSGRDAGLFGHERALALESTDGKAVAEARREGRQSAAGIEVGRDRAIVVWQDLPTDMLGSILDEGDLAARIAIALRLASELAITGAVEAAVAVSLNLSSMASFGDAADLGRRSGAQPIGFGGGPTFIQVDATDSVPAQAIGSGAGEIGREMARRVIVQARKVR